MVWKERTHSNSNKVFEETERMSTMGAVLRPVNHWLIFFFCGLPSSGAEHQPWAWRYKRGTYYPSREAQSLSPAGRRQVANDKAEEPEKSNGACGIGSNKTGLSIKNSRAKIYAAAIYLRGGAPGNGNTGRRGHWAVWFLVFLEHVAQGQWEKMPCTFSALRSLWVRKPHCTTWNSGNTTPFVWRSFNKYSIVNSQRRALQNEWQRETWNIFSKSWG